MDINMVDSSFLVKSFIELVNTEASRIISDGLIKECDLKAHLNNQISNIITKHAENKDDFVIIKCLSDIHNELSSIKLPQDIKEPEKLNTVEDEDEDDEEEMEDKLEHFIEEDIKNTAQTVCDTLQKIAHYVGERGDHHAAFLIERTINSIKNGD